MYLELPAYPIVQLTGEVGCGSQLNLSRLREVGGRGKGGTFFADFWHSRFLAEFSAFFCLCVSILHT